MKNVACLLLSPLLLSIAGGQDVLPAPAAETAALPAASPRVSVLSYGAIGTEPGAMAPAVFEREMYYLREVGMKVISPAEYLEWSTGKKPLSQNAVLLAFSDVGDGFLTHAVPVLQRCGFAYMVMTEEAGGAAGCTAVTDDASFARAVNFGPVAGEKNVMEDLQACAPAQEAVPQGVALPEFSDDDVAEEVSDEEAAAILPVPDEVPTLVPAEPAPAEPAPAEPAPAEPAPAEPAPAEPAPAEPAPAEPAPAEPAPAEPAPAEPAPAEPAPAEPAPAEPAPAEPAPAEPAPTELLSVEASYGVLGKRTPEGDWVSAQFKQPLVPREQTQVSVLGYHNFSKTKPRSEMRMSTADFCRQMQFLKDSDICVISMQDFLEWRHGSRCLPARCVLITIDDGWKSVYTDAYPVLKAYGYPFTLYLYTRYINVQGDSMTTAQIKEMMAHGATIGSHSSNHLYPSKWKRYSQSSPQYAAQLKKELLDSRDKLMSMFGNCSTYCYPGGYNTPPMLKTLSESGYRAAFTVLESKVGCEESPFLVHRYMIFGTNHEIFRRAVNFGGQEGVAPTRAAIAAAEEPARAFFPAAFEGCTNREGGAPAADASSRKASRKPATKKHRKPVRKETPKPDLPEFVTDPGQIL